MNVPLLQKVMRAIQKEPRRLRMNIWAEKVNPKRDNNAPCGTAACIAGHVPFVLGTLSYTQFGDVRIKGYRGEVDTYAKKELKLTREQAEKLFLFKNWNSGDENPNGWPVEFSRAYNKARTPKERAKAAIARIKHFIKTKGAE